MTPQLIFHVANSAALVAWVVLLFAPLRRWAALFAARGMGVVLSVGYLIFLAISFSNGPPQNFDSLDGIAAMLGRPEGALVGWIHYLAFDLWVGAWQVEEAGRRRLPHLLVVPCLALTFLVGPVGLLAYLALRAVKGRTPEAA